MNFFQKLFLLQQDLLIRYKKVIEISDIYKLGQDSMYKVELTSNKVYIKRKRSFLAMGMQGFIEATGKVNGNTIDFTIEYDKLRQGQFMTFTILGIILSAFLHWIFLLPTVILYLALQSNLIIMRSEIIKMFEKIWKQV